MDHHCAGKTLRNPLLFTKAPGIPGSVTGRLWRITLPSLSIVMRGSREFCVSPTRLPADEVLNITLPPTSSPVLIPPAIIKSAPLTSPPLPPVALKLKGCGSTDVTPDPQYESFIKPSFTGKHV